MAGPDRGPESCGPLQVLIVVSGPAAADHRVAGPQATIMRRWGRRGEWSACRKRRRASTVVAEWVPCGAGSWSAFRDLRPL